jgi:hypothetical protein
MNYKLAYRIGFHPWEEALHQQPFVASLSKLLDAEERGREKPTATRSTSAPVAASGQSSWPSAAGT